MKYKKITHEFVDKIPDSLEEGKLYVSISYATAVHRCFCGCGNEVVTPFGPTDWKLIYDGETVSLSPSIGNWGFPCMSHYWIRNNGVQVARRWNQGEIEDLRKFEKNQKKDHFEKKAELNKKKVWNKIKDWF